MNIKSLLISIAIYATVISAATCPGPFIIKTFTNKDEFNTGADVSVTIDTAGYKLIGGGFQTSGFLLTKSYPTSTTTWTINAHAITASVGPGPVTAYAIGLYDPDNCWTVQQVVSGPSSLGSETGSGTAVCPSGTTLVGGGATTDRYLATNYPDTVRGSSTSASQWSSSFGSASSSFVGPSSTGLSVYAMCLKPTGTGYSSGNFINNAAGSTAFSARSTNRLQIVGGGFIVNGQYGAVSLSYNSSNAWEVTSNQQSGTSVQSLSIGLSFSGSSSPSPSSGTSTTGQTSAPQKTCIGQIITTPRTTQGGYWISGSTSYQIYDIVVKNQGECPIVRATYDSFFTGPNNAGVFQKWNIGESSSSQILGSELNLFGNSIPAGGERSGYGVIVYNATGATYVASGPTTFCSSSCTNFA